MIKNLEDFKKVEDRMEIMHYPLEVTEVIPDEMPKLVAKRDYYNNNMLFDFEQEFKNSTKEMHLRETYTDQGMFAFVSWKWVNPLVQWLNGRKCLEVMAGRGWLSYALRQKGVDVIATDDYSWANTRGWKKPLTEVIDLDAIESINKYGKEVDIVIMSWPYMDNTAYKVIKRLHEVNPLALVIYIGESAGGCTADDDFHDAYTLEETDEEFWDEVAPHFQSWNHIHDRLWLGKYNGEISEGDM